MARHSLTRALSLSLLAGALSGCGAPALDGAAPEGGDRAAAALICPAPGTYQYYSYVGAPAFDLRARTGFVAAYGSYWGVHQGTAGRFAMTPDFHRRASDILRYIDEIARAGAGRSVDWIGTAGAGGCDDKQHHGNARALDITRIVFSDGTAVDARGSWEVAEVGNNRAYAGLIAASRIFLGPGSVLSAPIAGGHDNHVHIDTTWPGGPLTTGSPADRVLLRRINRVFGGSARAVDSSAWTAADGAALRATLAAFGFPACYDVFGNGWHTIGFLDVVARHGFANRPAGSLPARGC